MRTSRRVSKMLWHSVFDVLYFSNVINWYCFTYFLPISAEYTTHAKCWCQMPSSAKPRA
jgi:hypothetical protein